MVHVHFADFRHVQNDKKFLPMQSAIVVHVDLNYYDIGVNYGVLI